MATEILPDWKNISIQIITQDRDPANPFKRDSKWYLVHIKGTNSIILIPENWNESNVELYTNIIPYEHNGRVMVQYNDGRIIHTGIGIITNIELYKIWNGTRLMVYANKDTYVNTLKLVTQFDHMESIHREHLTDGFFVRFEKTSTATSIVQDGNEYGMYIDEIFLDSIHPTKREEICDYIQRKYEVSTTNEDGNSQIIITPRFGDRSWIYRYVEITPIVK